MTEEKYRTHELCQFNYSDIWEKSFDENYTDKPLRNDEVVKLLNEKDKEIQQLKAQAQTNDVCCICNSQYLIKKDPLREAMSNGETVPFTSPLGDIEPYYVAKCKKGHVECSKEDVMYCEDFELKGDE